MGERIALPAEQVAALSGHSMRVGATEELRKRNIDLASVMRSGRWKSARVPMRYGEQIRAGLAGIA
jgi:hypothetical protein